MNHYILLVALHHASFSHLLDQYIPFEHQNQTSVDQLEDCTF